MITIEIVINSGTLSEKGDIEKENSQKLTLLDGKAALRVIQAMKTQTRNITKHMRTENLIELKLLFPNWIIPLLGNRFVKQLKT